ncbi:MAG: molybdopterin-dependent oxidoreductase [candidate division Zixibacteria bacterium]|nr:molybdopterin-dependent oxidoreductase [candidate division Zixibacteria bacterium]
MKHDSKHKIVGSSVPRVDAFDKVSGRAKYAADYNAKGQLYGMVCYASHPHAKILNIDTGKAAKLPGVRAVLTHEDIPGEKSFGSVIPHQMALCSDKVRYSGDVVAIVAAESIEVAEQAIELIDVDYRQLDVVSDPKVALKDGAILIHDENNLCAYHKVRRGNIDEGFEKSDVILERDYSTSKIEHSYIEPEAVLAEPGENGGITITGSVQNLYSIRRAVARVLGLSLNRVRIIQATLGGSFGGKDETMSALCCRAGLLALATGKPVKMVNTREMSMRESYKRHSYQIHYKVGSTKCGILQAIESEIYADAGAYAAMSPFVTWRSAVHATGPYSIPNVKTDVYAAYTNNCYTGAMRGFGSPQICFAIESLIDELAEELNLDPLELRLKNILKDNSITATGQGLKHKVSLKEVLDNVTEKMGFVDKWKQNREQKRDTAFKRGIGISCSYRGISLGAEGTDAAGVIISIQTDGSVILSTGLIEMGQGAATTISMIVSEKLGITPDRIRFLSADTSRSPDSGPTVASRTTFMAGNAALRGCHELLERIKPVAAELLRCPEQDLLFENNSVYAPNKTSEGDRKIPFSELADKCFQKGISLFAHGWYKSPPTTWNEENGQGDAYFTYVYGANLAEVEVDCITGNVRVLKFISSHDPGQIVNLSGALGQVYGGVIMGIGYAMLENYAESEGNPLVANFDEYLLPTACDIPEIETTLIHNPDELGPLGAKSLGEPACEIAAPAIANAVFNATGMRIRHLPLTLERVKLGKELVRIDSRGSVKARGG